MSGAAPACRYRAVIFDLDGTLADTEPLVIGCMLETIRAAGHPVTEEQLLRYIGPPLPIMLNHMLGLDLEAAQPIYLDYLERYRRDYMPRTTPLPGAERLLDALREAGVPIALVTNKREDAGRQTVDLLGWSERFATVIGADTAEAPKPDAAPILLALKVLGASPEEAAIVGDTESDMGAGRNAGLAGVIGLVGVRDADYLRNHGATQTAADLDEVRRILFDDTAPAPNGDCDSGLQRR